MRRFVLAVFATLLAAPAFAQSYPDHPIRIIVPTPAGRLHLDGVGGERADHEPDDLCQCRL